MKKYLLFLLAAILPAPPDRAQQPPGVACQEWQVVAGDTIPTSAFARCGSSPASRPAPLRKLVAAVKKYPVAKIARARMTEMEIGCNACRPKAQKALHQGVYRQIKEEYTPVVKHMTRTQGKVLLKLIDTWTDLPPTKYCGNSRRIRGRILADLVARLRGRTSNRVRRRRDDRLLEQIVRYYEAGLLDLAVRSNHGRRPGRTVFRKYRLFSDRSEYSRFCIEFVNEWPIRLPFDEQPSIAPPYDPAE